jgi:Galactose oxidase, central domain
MSYFAYGPQLYALCGGGSHMEVYALALPVANEPLLPLWWERVVPVSAARPCARARACCLELGGGRGLLVHGGRCTQAAGKLLDDLWEFDVASAGWRQRRVAPASQNSEGAVPSAWRPPPSSVRRSLRGMHADCGASVCCCMLRLHPFAVGRS